MIDPSVCGVKQPNATLQARPIAGATQERRLVGVGSSARPGPHSRLGVRPPGALALPRQYHCPGRARTVPRTDALVLASSMRASARGNPRHPPAHGPAYGLSSWLTALTGYP